MGDDYSHQRDSSTTRRRTFLKGLGALGVVGLAGCGGDGGDDTDTPTDTETATETGTTTETGTATGTATETDTPGTGTRTDTPGTDTVTPTATPRDCFTDQPAQLLGFDGSLQAAPGSTATLTGEIQNSYLFPIVDGEFTIDPPSDDWSVSAAGGTTFESLDTQATQSAEWEVTVPDDASGSFDLSVSGTFSGEGCSDEANVSFTQTVIARTPGAAPIGLDCGGGHFDEVPTIDGLPFRPTEDQRANITFSQTNMQPVPEGSRWWTEGGNVTVTPGTGAENEINAATNDSVTSIEGTDADVLYRSEWWQTDQFTVTIDIENGTYDVILHLAEITYPDEEGARVFGATVNGETAFEGLDLTADVGGATAATRAVEGLEVTDNQIAIDVESSVENPKLSGIEIRES